MRSIIEDAVRSRSFLFRSPNAPQKESIDLFLRGRTIQVEILRKNIKNRYIRITRDGAVVLSVPKRTSDRNIERLLAEKRDWIELQLTKCETRKKLFSEARFQEGAILRFLGSDRVLRILKSATNQADFEQEPFAIRLFLKDPTDEDLAARTFEKGVRLVLENYVQCYIDRWMPIFSEKGVRRPEVRIRKMRAIWGNCAYNKGRITLNETLYQADPRAIEYVVLHELTHFLYHNHDKKFYDFLSAIMPDHKERKKLLNGK